MFLIFEVTFLLEIGGHFVLSVEMVVFDDLAVEVTLFVFVPIDDLKILLGKVALTIDVAQQCGILNRYMEVLFLGVLLRHIE